MKKLGEMLMVNRFFWIRIVCNLGVFVGGCLFGLGLRGCG